MKLRKIFLSLILFALLAGACTVLPTSGASTAQPATPAPQETRLPTNPAPEAAVQYLAGQLGVPADQIEIVSFEPADWPNACLGLQNPGEGCADVVTPGYEVVLKKGDTIYTVRTDQSGKIIRLEPAGTAVAQAPAAAARAIDLLAKDLKVDASQVKLISAEVVEWPDACLGINEPGQMCAQVITPGYRIVLEAQGKRYEYHTNQDGSAARRATGLAITTGGVLLDWMGKGAGCLAGKFSASEVAYGACTSSSLQNAPLQAQRSQELASLVSTYQPFQAVTPQGSLAFNGEGAQAATPDEQRSIAEWARLAAEEAQAGQTNAAAGLVLGWHREGGIAGFCDDLAVYLTGFAYPSSCKGGGSYGFVRLTADQLKQVYAWHDSLKSFEQTQSDPAAADAMTQKLAFTGAGSGTPSAADQQAMLALAGEVFASAGTPLALPSSVPAASPLVEGRVILIRYFQHLAAGSYAEAVNLYGGSYDTLADMNPSVDAQDHARLFEQACKVNGHQCQLTVKEVLQEKQVSPTEFQYKVTFANPDGSLFTLGPCCGASPTDQPPASEFNYTVLKTAAGYAVQQLPVYVP